MRTSPIPASLHPRAATRGRRVAMLLFFSQVGSRLAATAAAPLAAALVAGLIVQHDPAATTLAVALALFGPTPAPSARVVAAAAGATLAAWAAPRISRGVSGWFRHLPASAADVHISTLAALVVAQAPLAVGLTGLAIVAAEAGRGVNLASLLALPVILTAAAVLVVPASHRAIAAGLAVAAILASCLGSPAAVLAGAAIAVVGAWTGGPPRGRRGAALPVGTAQAHVADRIAVRALGWPALGAYVWAAFPLAAGVLFRANNQLDAGIAAPALRLGGGLSAVVLLAGLADRLAVARPAWPWARSLPWSARMRVMADARLLAVATLPVLVASAVADPWSLPPLVGVAALGVALAAGTVRRAPERRTGAAGEVLAGGALVAAWVALVPLLALLSLALVPIAFRRATERERSVRVSRWLERHHLAAGDSLSWSG